MIARGKYDPLMTAAVGQAHAGTSQSDSVPTIFQFTFIRAFILRSKSQDERCEGDMIAQLWDAGRPEESHKALGCMAATGRMESKRLRDETAAVGTRDLMISIMTDDDKGLLQQLQRAEHTECHEQCSVAASKCVCLQQEIKDRTAAKIENFSRAEMSFRRDAAKSAS